MTPQLARQIDRCNGIPITIFDHLRHKLGLFRPTPFTERRLVTPMHERRPNENVVLSVHARELLWAKYPGSFSEGGIALWELKDGRFMLIHGDRSPDLDAYFPHNWYIAERDEIDEPDFGFKMIKKFNNAFVVRELLDQLGIAFVESLEGRHIAAWQAECPVNFANSSGDAN